MAGASTPTSGKLVLMLLGCAAIPVGAYFFAVTRIQRGDIAASTAQLLFGAGALATMIVVGSAVLVQRRHRRKIAGRDDATTRKATVSRTYIPALTIIGGLIGVTMHGPASTALLGVGAGCFLALLLLSLATLNYRHRQQ